jgi:hypothetical protein
MKDELTAKLTELDTKVGKIERDIVKMMSCLAKMLEQQSQATTHVESASVGCELQQICKFNKN